MFGFNKKKRLIENPVTFEAEVEIQKPASEVFALVDLANPKSQLAQQGADVKKHDGEEGRYTVALAEMDDVTFNFRVTERVEGAKHTLECVMEPQMFALVHSQETHTIEAKGESACRVTLKTVAKFDGALSDPEMAGEIAIMSEAVTRDLEKLKLLAEEGIEAVQAFEEEAMGFDFEFGDLEMDWDGIEPEQ